MAETERAQLLQNKETTIGELRQRLEGQLSAEVAAHAATREELASLEKQKSALSVQVDASKAQLQANSISSQKRQSQFEQQKSALEASWLVFVSHICFSFSDN